MSDYLKKLFIDEAKAVLFKGSAASGGGTVNEDNIATNEEVNDALDEVFNSDSSTVLEDNIT